MSGLSRLPRTLRRGGIALRPAPFRTRRERCGQASFDRRREGAAQYAETLGLETALDDRGNARLTALTRLAAAPPWAIRFSQPTYNRMVLGLFGGSLDLLKQRTDAFIASPH